MSHPYVILNPYVILSEAKDLVLIGHGHAPCHSSLKSRQSGLSDSIKATFFARNQPLMCFLVNDPKHEHLTPILSSTTIDNLENRSTSRWLCAVVGNSSRKLATLSENLVSYRGKGRGRV